jgi:hypothetical protein
MLFSGRRSRQRTSCLLTRLLQWKATFSTLPVAENPSRRVFDVESLALIGFGARAGNGTVGIIHVVERRAEHLFLLRAVWAPSHTVHIWCGRGWNCCVM